MNLLTRHGTMRFATALLQSTPLLPKTAFTAAALRHRALVLLYHRVSNRTAAVVPVVTPAVFEAQLETLATIADLVPLGDLRSQPPGNRVRIAVTFDDDHRSHVEDALPVLERLHVPATFFLSGRSLHHLPPYWFELLDDAIGASGAPAVARSLGVSGNVADIARRCEEDPRLAERVSTLLPPRTAGSQMQAADIRALAAAGMTIGFHTLHHQVLPSLDDAALERALRDGRTELAQAAGTPVTLIAYPHGKADLRVARAASRAGFDAGFATGGRAITPRSNPFLLARWEPGPMPARSLVAQSAIRLHAAS